MDFIVGLALGLVFFFGIGFLFDKLFTDLGLISYLIPFVLFVIYIRLYKGRSNFNNRKASFILSFLSFLFGFFLPSLTWIIIVILALRNAQLGW